MADTTHSPAPLRNRLAKIDKAWLAFGLILMLLTGEWVGRKMMRYA